MAGMLSSCHPSQSQAAAFTEQQLKQLRAQCLVFLISFRNNMEVKKKHLEIALGEIFAEGSSSSHGGGDESGLSSSSPVVFSASIAGLPPPDLSTLRLSTPQTGPRRIVRRGPRKIQRSKEIL